MPGVTTAYQNGIHSARPAANSGCILYACSTHSLIYRSDGSTWTTWMTIGSSVTTVANDAIWDTAGDLAVGTGADTAAKLALTVPAANILNVLGVANGETTPTWKAIFDGTAPASVAAAIAAAAGTSVIAAHRDHQHGALTFHGAKAYKAGTQTVSAGNEDAIAFATEEYDTDTFHDNSTNPSRFTAPVTGYYRLTATIWAASGLGNATSPSAMSFYVNGTVVRGGSLGDVTSANGAGGANQLNLSAETIMTSGQYAEVKFYNGTAGNVVLGHASAASVENTMSIALLGI